MPAPTNTTVDNALDLGALPFSATFDLSSLTAPLYEVWFTWLGDNTVIHSVQAVDALSNAYRTLITIYTGTPTTLTTDIKGNGDVVFDNLNNQYFTVPITNGQRYYIRVRNNSGGSVSPIELTFSVTPAPLGTPNQNDIFITDDQPGFPTAIINADTGAIVRYVDLVGGSDFDLALANGSFLLEDPFNEAGRSVAVYDIGLRLVASLTMESIFGSLSGLDLHGGDGRNNNFYLGVPGFAPSNPNARIGVVTDAGAIGRVYVLPAIGLLGMAVSPDETIAYYTQAISGAIKRWDLVNDVAMSDFLAAGNLVGSRDLLCLDDGTIVYFESGQHKIRQYAVDGTLLHTWTFTDSIDRIARINGDPSSIKIWFWRVADSGTSDFATVRLSDGAITQETGDVPQYEVGIYGSAPTVPISKFGTSNSCPLLMLSQKIETTSPPPTLVPPIPCCADGEVPTTTPNPPGSGPGAPPTNPGEILPFVTAVWMPVCAGGGMVPTQADLVDVESWV